MNILFDILVVGSGFAGAVTARKLAEEYGKRVLLLEKRAHIGGNMYDYPENSVTVHRYGPHIFHTSNSAVFEYLSRFSGWREYRHRVLGRIDGKLVPIPFNFTSLETLLPERAKAIEQKLLTFYPADSKPTVTELLNHPDEEIRAFGQFVYDKVFVNYTAKQWGTRPELIDKSVIARVPVVLGYGEHYFSDSIQAMPERGFTKLFEAMLNHPNITVELDCDADQRLRFDESSQTVYFDGESLRCPVVYTGAVDGLLRYKYGTLPYRSLDLRFEALSTTYYQPVSVVNYPNEEAYTRITEFKHLTGEDVPDSTVILKEYPRAYDSSAGTQPYYPIPNEQNQAVFEMYKTELEKYGVFYLCGRLAEYKYYNMDAVVARAMQTADQIGADQGWKPVKPQPV